MAKTFRTQRQRFNEALERADIALAEARGLLDELPAVVDGETQARQLLEAHQTMRDALRSHQRFLEKL